MPTLYPNTSMTVREASNNINRSIVEKDYRDTSRVASGILFQWEQTGEDYLWCDTYCNLDDLR